MSGLIDMWSNGVRKLREKGQDFFPDGSNPDHHVHDESSHVEAKEGNLSAKFPAFIQEMGIMKSSSSLGLPSSEASVSMLVNCFSP